MKLAIGTCFDYRVQLVQQFSEIADTPFQLVSLGGDPHHSGYLTGPGRKGIIELTAQCGIKVDSLHVPYSQKYDPSWVDSEERSGSVCRIAMAMAAAVELGANTVILHLNSWPSQPDRQSDEALLRSLEALIESAENMQIKLAAENLPGELSLRFLRRALEEFKSGCFGFCYDSSHDQLGPDKPYEILEKYADRLFAVHLSDNDGQEDRHWIPFTGIVDWKRVCGILKAARYSYPLLLEVENPGEMPTAEFLAKSADAAVRLRELIVG
jgi:sugar phosphate isomerase/epimerase